MQDNGQPLQQKGDIVSNTEKPQSLPIFGVIFDMDGLLLDSETLAMDALVAAGHELGYDMPATFCRRMIGVPADGCEKLVRETYGHDFPLRRFFDLQEKHLRDFVDNGKLVLKSGVTPLIALLDELRLPRAIATSSSRMRAHHHLKLVGLDKHFPVIVTRDDVDNGKPHPEPYLKAAHLIGIEPRFCLALEDSHSGARAAVAAGMRVIIVPDLLEPTEDVKENALAIVNELTAVQPYIRLAAGMPIA